MRDGLRRGRAEGFPLAVSWRVLVIVLLLAWKSGRCVAARIG